MSCTYELNRRFEEDQPRDLSVCQYSLTTPRRPLIVEDLLEDEHTRERYSHPDASPFRFYAGAPLISCGGFHWDHFVWWMELQNPYSTSRSRACDCSQIRSLR